MPHSCIKLDLQQHPLMRALESIVALQPPRIQSIQKRNAKSLRITAELQWQQDERSPVQRRTGLARAEGDRRTVHDFSVGTNFIIIYIYIVAVDNGRFSSTNRLFSASMARDSQALSARPTTCCPLIPSAARIPHIQGCC